jgi:hypothetical protein
MALAVVVVGCASGNEDEDASPAQPAAEIFEMPTYRFAVPDGWTTGVDEDPASEEGAGFRGTGDSPVHGSISRNPAGRTASAGLGASARERIVKINEGHRGVANLLEIGDVERFAFDIDGEEAWRTDARFGSDAPGQSFVMLWVAFQHDGQDYVVTFEGGAPLAGRDVAAFEELLRSWEFA